MRIDVPDGDTDKLIQRLKAMGTASATVREEQKAEETKQKEEMQSFMKAIEEETEKKRKANLKRLSRAH